MFEGKLQTILMAKANNNYEALELRMKISSLEKILEFKKISDDAVSEMKSKKKLLTKSPTKWNLESVKICAEIRKELDEYTKTVTDIERSFQGAFAVDATTGDFIKDPFADEKDIETNYEFINDSTKTLEDITLK